MASKMVSLEQLDRFYQNEKKVFAKIGDVNQKQDKLIAGDNIQIAEDGKTIFATSDVTKAYVDEQNVKQWQMLKSLQREVNLQKDFAKDILWRKETDTEEAYTKAIPSGAKGVVVNSIGGKCLVVNQLASDVDTFTLKYAEDKTVNIDNHEIIAKASASANRLEAVVRGLKVGHKYYGTVTLKTSNLTDVRVMLFPTNSKYCKNANTYERFSEIWTSNATMMYYPRVNDDREYADKDLIYLKNIMVIDLTTMFGAGNEPTAEEFEAMFPNYIPYTEPTLQTIACNEVEVKGKNLFDEVAWAEENNLPIGSDGYITVVPKVEREFWVNEKNIKGAISMKYDIENASTQRAIFFDVYYDDNTDEAVYPWNSKHAKQFTTPNTKNVQRIVRSFGSGNNNGKIKDIQIEQGAIATDYSPYNVQTIPIPATIQALEGYGWRAGEVYNEVDFENKKFIQRAGRVDLGSLNWVKDVRYENTQFYNPSLFTKMLSNSRNIVCEKYAMNNLGWMNKPYGTMSASTQYIIIADNYADANAFKQAVQGVYIYYELAEPIITDISDLLADFDNNTECEANGSITFKNTLGEDYRVPIPNELEYYVKVSEAL